ncbi:outer membrane lipoprotein carrier protein LolA [Candidatus Poribacteria bacterium]|nr:outer membrane lipoprotein carrier protein LolA [Candidatus Poribacteria bacterium]
MIRRIYSSTMLRKSTGFHNLPLVVLILSLLFLSSAYPQNVNEIFQNFKQAYDKSNNFSANFEETTLFANTKSVASGRIVFSKPNLLRREYVGQKDASKVIQITVFDGKYGWTYTPTLNQVNKMKLNNPKGQLFPGIGASLDDFEAIYDMVLVPDEFANPKGIHNIELTPKKDFANPDVKEKFQIWVKSDGWLPVQVGHEIELEDGSRQSAIVKFSEIKRDTQLAPDIFKFVVPKDAEVINLSEN